MPHFKIVRICLGGNRVRALVLLCHQKRRGAEIVGCGKACRLELSEIVLCEVQTQFAVLALAELDRRGRHAQAPKCRKHARILAEDLASATDRGKIGVAIVQPQKQRAEAMHLRRGHAKRALDAPAILDKLFRAANDASLHTNTSPFLICSIMPQK